MKIRGKKTADNPSGETYLVDAAEGSFTKTDKIPGKEWFRMDQNGRQGEKEDDRSRARGLLAELLGAFTATGDASWVGPENIGGRITDHLRGTVVVAELAKYQESARESKQRDWYVNALKKAGTKQVVIDIWIGADGLGVKSQEASHGTKGQQPIVEEYRDYGADLKDEVPPAHKVASFDEYIEALSKR